MKHAVAVNWLALALCTSPVFAQTAIATSGEAQAPATTGAEQEAEKPPATEEVAGKVDALTEAFTEMKNTLDGLNRMRLSGYIQAQYVNDQASVNSLSSPTATRNRDQFSVRRARVKFTYQFSPTSRFVLQPDITSSGVTLKDGYVEFTEPWTAWHHTLTAGQFNWPFGFEIMYSSSDREMPERSRVIRALFPGERDRGVQVSGTGFADRFNYRLAIVNGTGTAQSFDFNKRKDIVGRIGGTIGPLDIGVSTYRGAELVSVTGATAGREFDKERHGVDFQFVTPVPGLGIRGEYIVGKQPPPPGAAANAAIAADVEGYYVYIIQNIGTRNQFVLRYDAYDPDSDNQLPNAIGNAQVGTLGGSYIFHWDANSKVMATYERSKTSGFADPDDNVFTLRYQFKF